MRGIPASRARPAGTGTGRTWQADPETGIITDEKLTRAAGTANSDPAVAEEFVAGEAAGDSAGATGGAGQPGPGAAGGGAAPLAWYGDSAYGTGDLRDAIEKAGHQAVIKPRPLRPRSRAGSPSMTSPSARSRAR
jgi:hypothetical protein